MNANTGVWIMLPENLSLPDAGNNSINELEENSDVDVDGLDVVNEVEMKANTSCSIVLPENLSSRGQRKIPVCGYVKNVFVR